MGGFRHCATTVDYRIDPPVMGTRVMPESVHSVEHMMESVALPGGGAQSGGTRLPGGGKTGTAKKIGPDGKYIDKYVATAGVAPASRPQFALVVVMNDPSNGSLLRRRCVRAGLPARSWAMSCGWRTSYRTACRRGRRIPDRNAR
ncbi:hypothetical protein MJ561_18615 [Klebsiella pneumoniae]|nr:hypothetical protein MJ561_18615 [Klebsiella pneumoniae]